MNTVTPDCLEVLALWPVNGSHFQKTPSIPAERIIGTGSYPVPHTVIITSGPRTGSFSDISDDYEIR